MFRSHCLALGCAAMMLAPGAAWAAGPIKIGFPIPLSGPTAVYGVPILKGAELAADEINAKGGVLGRKLEFLPRDSKANADEAVRLARELIIKDNVDFPGRHPDLGRGAGGIDRRQGKQDRLSGAVGEDTIGLTAPANLHPYIFRVASNTDVEGPAGAIDHGQMAGHQDGRDDRARLCLWPRRYRRLHRQAEEAAPGHRRSSTSNGRSSASRTSPRSSPRRWARSPTRSIASLFAGDFVTFVKQATPLGYFKAINNRLVDGGEVGTADEAQALGADYPYGISADAYDPVIWSGDEPPAHKTFIEHLRSLHQIANTLRAGR